MKLISCDNCGVFLDADKLDFPALDESDPRDQGFMEWCNDRLVWVATVPCPVCEAKILSPGQ
jgi:hypothetical protein